MRRAHLTFLALTFAIASAAGAAVVPLGPVQPVPTPSGFGGVLPAVANAPDGRFIVIYPGGTTEQDVAIRYQIFDPAGQAVTAELVASTNPVVILTGDSLTNSVRLVPRVILPSFYSPPQVAMNAAGESLAVWSGGPGGAVDVRARLLRRNGNPQGGEILVNTVTTGDQGHASVAAIAGGWVVVWQSASFAGVRARLFDGAGTPRSGEITVNDFASGVQFEPSVAGLPGGGFIVSWTGEVAGNDSGDVLLRRFDANGNPVGPSVLANTTTASAQFGSSIATNASGDSVVSWTDAGGDVNIFSQRFDPSGIKVGQEVRVNTPTEQLQVDSHTGMDALGRYTIAWGQQNFGSGTTVEEALFARPYTSDAVPLAADVKVTTTALSPTYNPSLAMDAGGDFVVAGSGVDGDVFLRRFTLPCEPGPTVLCLQGGRFKVETAWRTNQGTNGMGQAVALSPDTGYFWFFNQTNVEMVVKVLNGCPANNRFWAFAGGLTNVEVQLLVTDTLTGQVRSYLNPIATPFQPIQDTGAFPTCGTRDGEAGTAIDAEREAAEVERLIEKLAAAPTLSQSATHACTPSATRLCLRSGRFEITVNWRTGPGNQGEGKGVPLTSDTGYFWFFNPANVEMLIKVLNGCGLNGHYWVFAGGLTNVRADITVKDTATGVTRLYTNPLSTPFQPLQDTQAFSGCP